MLKRCSSESRSHHSMPITSPILMDSQINEVSYAILSLIELKLFFSPSEPADTDGLDNAMGSQMTIRIY